jgi:Zn-dependent protease with chaperone function
LAGVLTLAVAAAIIGGVGWICAKFFHRVPAGMLLMVGLGAVFGVFAVLKGIVMSFWRRPSFETGLLIDLQREPQLREFLGTLCSLMGTKMPTSVILHADSQFFVQQGRVRVFNGTARGRVLAISVPLLSELTVGELRAVLAHEFAHFTGQDTLYSSVVLPVYVSTGTTLQEMSGVLDSSFGHGENSSGSMGLPLLLPFFCLNWYVDLFHRLNMRLSRLREHRADSIAAICCGTDNFSRALTKTASVGTLFTSAAWSHIGDALEERKAFENYYSAFREMRPELHEAATELERQALAETEAPNASHPCLASRLTRVPRVAGVADDRPAMCLLAHLDEYEQQLTEGLTQIVAMSRPASPMSSSTEAVTEALTEAMK